MEGQHKNTTKMNNRESARYSPWGKQSLLSLQACACIIHPSACFILCVAFNPIGNTHAITRALAEERRSTHLNPLRQNHLAI